MKALTEAQTKMGTLGARKRQTAGSCSKVVELSTKLATLAQKFTTSPDIQLYSGQISSAGSLSCTATEKASLKAASQNFQKALTEISNALAVAKDDLTLLSPPAVNFHDYYDKKCQLL